MQTETDSPVSSAVGSRDVSMSRDASLSRGAGRGDDVDVEDRNVDAGRDRDGARRGREGRRDLGIPRGWGKGSGRGVPSWLEGMFFSSSFIRHSCSSIYSCPPPSRLYANN